MQAWRLAGSDVFLDTDGRRGRKQEQEAEQQTIEAYYQARLEEMQSQYEKLLGEIDDAKKHAQDQVYRKFDSNAPVVPPPEAPGSPGGGVRSRPSPTKK